MSAQENKQLKTKEKEQSIQADVNVLAGEIGPRGTGTPGEAAAADYVSKRLIDNGLKVDRKKFQAVNSQNAFPMAINIVALLAVILYPLNGAFSRWIAAGLALSTAPMLWQTIRHSNNILRLFLPKVTSQNVISRVPALSAVRQNVVVLAHLDTNRCRKIWASNTVRYLEPLTYLTLSILATLGTLYLAGALLNDPGWSWWATLPIGVYIVGMMVSLWLDDRTPYSAGAHDNAASVAVALEVASKLVESPLETTLVWLAFTGAEETDHAGLKTLLRDHDSIMRQALFIGLEGLGSGEIVYLIRQGLCSHYRPDSEMLAAAVEVAEMNPGFGVGSGMMTMEDEVGALRRRGYKAICIAGMDPETNSLPHWHRADDTVDTVSVDVMEKAVLFIMALLKKLDSRV